MILYFSGTGNSEYIAKNMGQQMNDTVENLFERLRDRDFSKMYSDRPWIIVCPTYAWRIPRILQEWLENTRLSGNRDIYFIMTCGGNIGNAGKYLQQLCVSKSMNYRGCAGIVMPENYIALFTTPTRENALQIIAHAKQEIDKAVSLMKENKAIPHPSLTITDKLNSGIVNKAFYPLFVHAKKFYVTDKCISCGMCVKVCPLKNVHLQEGSPVWGNACTHCMACICRCPKEAIEYGKHSQGLPRYTFPK